MPSRFLTAVAERSTTAYADKMFWQRSGFFKKELDELSVNNNLSWALAKKLIIQRITPTSVTCESLSQ